MYVVRLIGGVDGTWTCRIGLVDLGTHLTFAQAMAEASLIAAVRSPVTIVVHHMDGSITEFSPVST